MLFFYLLLSTYHIGMSGTAATKSPSTKPLYYTFDGLQHVMINSPSINETNQRTTKMFNVSELVITLDLNSTTHPHLSDGLGIVQSSNHQNTNITLLLVQQTETGESFSFYNHIVLPTHLLRRLTYITDPRAYRNRDKGFLSPAEHTSLTNYVHIIDVIMDLSSVHYRHQHTKLILTVVFRHYGIANFPFTRFPFDLTSVMASIVAQYSNVRTVTGTIHAGDIVLIKQLKKQNNVTQQLLASTMSDSIGIIMQNVSRMNSRNQTEFRIECVSENNYFQFVALRRKYFYKITTISFHDVSRFEFSPINIGRVLGELLSTQNNVVINLTPYIFDSHLNYNPRIIQTISIRLWSVAVFCIDLRSNLHGKWSVIYRNDVVNFMSQLHLYVDKNALDRAIALSLVNVDIEGIREMYEKWCRQMKQMYEINHNRSYTIRRVSEFESSQKKAKKLARRVHDEGASIARDQLMLMWHTFLNSLINLYKNTLENIMKFGIGERSIGISIDDVERMAYAHPEDVIPRTNDLVELSLFSEILDHYLLSNKFGRDLHIVYEKEECDLMRFKQNFSAEINVKWNIHNIAKANELSQRFIIELQY
eukprot:188952_1